MGTLNDLVGQTVYLDTNIFIYAMERNPDYLAIIDQLFTALDAGRIKAVTSEITLAECLVKPFADRNTEFQLRYQAAITTRPGFTTLPISRPILIAAARLRALHKPRLPDAIHLATALDSACQTFLTNDQLVKPIPNLTLLQLADLAK